MFEGGKNGQPIKNATTTGYYLRKYVNNSVTFEPGETTTSQQHNWILFRYAEILLNYAEAMVNAYGDPDYTGSYSLSARDAVNQVRNRGDVKMPAYPTDMKKDPCTDCLGEGKGAVDRLFFRRPRWSFDADCTSGTYD